MNNHINHEYSLKLIILKRANNPEIAPHTVKDIEINVVAEIKVNTSFIIFYSNNTIHICYNVSLI